MKTRKWLIIFFKLLLFLAVLAIITLPYGLSNTLTEDSLGNSIYKHIFIWDDELLTLLHIPLITIGLLNLIPWWESLQAIRFVSFSISLLYSMLAFMGLSSLQQDFHLGFALLAIGAVFPILFGLFVIENRLLKKKGEG